MQKNSDDEVDKVLEGLREKARGAKKYLRYNSEESIRDIYEERIKAITENITDDPAAEELAIQEAKRKKDEAMRKLYHAQALIKFLAKINNGKSKKRKPSLTPQLSPPQLSV